MSTGAELIAAERQRQVEVECWTISHDATHKGEDLAMAAHCYALPRDVRAMEAERTRSDVPARWPWDDQFWKPTPDDRVRELVKAGALIAAEIDRLQATASGAVVTGPGSEGLQAVRLIAPAHCDECGTRHHDGSPPCSRAQAPVVPSVGAVPVEVPLQLPTDEEIRAVNDVADEYGVSRDVMHIALAKVHRLIAARVRAGERQRAASAIRKAAAEQAASFGADAEPYFKGRLDGLEDAARIAAGSAVPPDRRQLVDVIAAALCAQEEALDAGDEGGTWRGWSTDDVAELLASAVQQATPQAGSAVPVAHGVAIRVADKAAELATVSRVSYREAHTTLMAACGFVPAVPVATPEPREGNYADEFMPPSARIGDREARRLGLMSPSSTSQPLATPEPPTFDALLSDPMEQFDTRSVLLPALVRYLGLPATADVGPLMASIEAYRNAPPAAFTVPPVATPTEPGHEALHKAVNLAWPCRYGDAECPLLIRRAAEQDGQR